MASPKKTTAKKTTSKSASTRTSKAKAVAPKTTRATASKKTKAAAAKKAELKSFRVYRESQPFTQFQVTRQTIYWIVLVAFIVFAQLWILKLQIEVATLIEAQQVELQNTF